jgi:type IV secretion system protein VirB1
MFLGLTLTASMASLLHTCAPSIGTKTMAGILQYESGWHQYAIGDNDTHHAYYPTSAEQAVSVATDLLKLGHNLDAGIGQVNSDNWGPYGLSIRTVFKPCANVRVASQILYGDYASAMRENWIGHTIATTNDAYLQQQYALIHALSSYNSGKFWASMSYAGNVYTIARNVIDEEPAGFSGAIPPPGTPLMGLAPIHHPASGHHAVRLASLYTATEQSGPSVAFRPAWRTTIPAVTTMKRKHIAAPTLTGDK